MVTLRELAEAAKRLQDLSKTVEQLDLYEELLVQRELLLDAREAIAHLQEELANQIAEAEDKSDFYARTEKLVEVDGLNYRKNDAGEPMGSPYCPVCVERTDGLFELRPVLMAAGRPMECPNCNTPYFNVRTYSWNNGVQSDQSELAVMETGVSFKRTA